MLRLLLSVAVLSFVVAGERSSIRKLEPRIWNGKTSNQNQFPYMAGILIPIDEEDGNICGGALISPLFVMTAAHCVNFNETQKNENSIEIYIALGMYESFSGIADGQLLFQVRPQDVTAHPNFDIGYGYNDIALIRLPKQVTLTRQIQVISLPSHNQILPIGQNITTLGYGNDGENKSSDYLKYMVSQVLPAKDCVNRRHNFFQNDKEICVSAPNVSICYGDSGGPNVIITNEGKHIIVGITSRVAFSVSCEKRVPQIFTRVSYYLSWIHSVTGIPI